MIGAVAAKYAFRSLFRHTRRTILSVVGIGIGCGMALLAASWVGGSTEMQIRAVSESGGGHLRVVPAEWPATRENALRLADWERALREISKLEHVESVALRARANGLLGFGNRTAAVQITGVDPAVETAANRIVARGRIEGRYLVPDDEASVVIGRVLAKRLDVELDDELFVTLVGRDEIKCAMLTIVGIISTGGREIDETFCHVVLDDLERISGYSGPAEISVLLEDYRLIGAARKELAAHLAPGDAVITWKEVNPGLAGNVEGDKAFTRLLVGIIVVVVSLGIASAQLTSVLERRTEFAVLSALGMKSRQVVGLMMFEAVIVGLGGAAVALGLGGLGAYYLARHGISLEAFVGEGASLSFENVLLDPYLYGEFGLWLVWYALGISVTATVAASIYPAWLATRSDPADALRTV